MIQGVKNLVQTLLRPFGLRLSRLNSAPKPDFGSGVLFETLQKFGFSPRNVVDIGANHGNWTRNCLQYFPDARYTLVEPQDHLKIHVQDLLAAGNKIQWVNAGVSDQSGTLPFFLSHRDDSSTFLTNGADPSKTVPMRVTSLDDLLAEQKLSIPELVKIDAEGLDLKVIQGAKTLLGKTDVFLLEAAVLCPFENTVAATVKFMAEAGYRLIDITELNRSPKDNVLWLTELAFLRNSSDLLARADSYE